MSATYVGAFCVALCLLAAAVRVELTARRDERRQSEYVVRLQWRIDRAPEDAHYEYARLGKTAGEIGASDAESPTTLPALAVPAVSPSAVDKGQAVSR